MFSYSLTFKPIFIYFSIFFKLVPEFLMLSFIVYWVLIRSFYSEHIFNSCTRIVALSIILLFKKVDFLFGIILNVLVVQLFLCLFYFQFFFNLSLLDNLSTISAKFLLIILGHELIISILNYLFKNDTFIFNQQALKLTISKNWFNFPLLIVFAYFFIFILIASFDFLVFFLSLEGISLVSYVLLLIIQNTYSIEATIKYFFLGCFSSGIMLFGISFIYGIVGSLNYLEIQYFLTNISFISKLIIKHMGQGSSNYFVIFSQLRLITISFSFILFGFLFKLGLFPLHIWKPNIFEAATLPVVFFFSLILNFIFFFVFLKVYVFFYFITQSWSFILFISATGSLVVGCLGALGQKKLKGFIAYTSVNQMGYPLIAFSVNKKECLFSSFFFLVIYILITSFFFYLLFRIKDSTIKRHYKKEKAIIFLNQLRYLRLDKGVYIFSILVVFFSMAGIPPLAGFFGKYLILFTLIGSGLYFISFLIILVSIISAFYYLKILKIIFFDSSFTKKELNSKINIQFINESSIYLFYLLFICFFLFFFNNYSIFISDFVFVIKSPFFFFLL